MTTGDTLEEKLDQKLAAGEISETEYQKLRAKFERLGLLSTYQTSSKSSSVYKEGSTIIKGGKVNGSVNVHGRAEVQSSLECNRLSISGSVYIDGDLTVLGKSSISGELEVNGISKFVDKVAVSGRIKTSATIYSLANTSISGRTKIKGDLISEGVTLISGNTTMRNLKSTGLVKLSGKSDISEDLIAKQLEISKGKIFIGGDLKAEDISIFEQYFSNQSEDEMLNETPDDSIAGLVSNVVNVVFPTLVKTIKGITDLNPTVVEINGDVIGNDIKITHSTIHGNIVGDHIKIGPNTIVNGKIKYRKSVELPDNHIFNVEQVE